MNNIMSALQEMQFVANKLDPALFVISILASLAASLIAVFLYRFFYEHRGTGSQVHRSFPLLGISITTLFIGVQTSLPLSLGLLGALSIIRFRTPIKEPEEVGFIMLVIAASIMCATFNFQFLVILYVIAICALFLVRGGRFWKYMRRDGMVILNMTDSAAVEAMDGITSYVEKHTRHHALESSSSHDGRTSIQYSFTGMKQGVSEFQAGLRDLADSATINVFLDRPGGIR